VSARTLFLFFFLLKAVLESTKVDLNGKEGRAGRGGGRKKREGYPGTETICTVSCLDYLSKPVSSTMKIRQSGQQGPRGRELKKTGGEERREQASQDRQRPRNSRGPGFSARNSIDPVHFDGKKENGSVLKRKIRVAAFLPSKFLSDTTSQDRLWKGGGKREESCQKGKIP